MSRLWHSVMVIGICGGLAMSQNILRKTGLKERHSASKVQYGPLINHHIDQKGKVQSDSVDFLLVRVYKFLSVLPAYVRYSYTTWQF